MISSVIAVNVVIHTVWKEQRREQEGREDTVWTRRKDKTIGTITIEKETHRGTRGFVFGDPTIITTTLLLIRRWGRSKGRRISRVARRRSSLATLLTVGD